MTAADRQPQNLISGKNYQGRKQIVTPLASVTEQKCRPYPDVMVLSTDTLIYGGLVDSRKTQHSTDYI